MGNPEAAAPRRSNQALYEAGNCPHCDTSKYPPKLCDEHRCSGTYADGTPCRNSRTYPDLGVCGLHRRERPETEEAKILRQVAEVDPDGGTGRLLRRLALIPDHLSASEKFQAGLAINADEFLAEVIRGDGDKGAQMREAGYTALADALGL